MGKCLLCNREGLVSRAVGVCIDCLRRNPEESLGIVRSLRSRWRSSIDFPPKPPRSEGGLRCSICINECVMGDGERGFCGIWVNMGGRISPLAGLMRMLTHIYLDPIPTNCVAGHICPGSTGAGYPKYAYSPNIEVGYYNLAVFMAGCPLDCSFCQNWEHKTAIAGGKIDKSLVRNLGIGDLVERSMDPRVSCICYFGGDPTPHLPMLIAASRDIVKKSLEKGVIKRICWETDGLANPLLMREMARLSLVSGGIVKIDWKAWTPSIYEALTGVDGNKAIERLMENTKIVSELGRERPEVPLLVISILLVPGYVDASEVRSIAEYIARLNPETPLVLLAFHPDHLMKDLPPTSWRHMREAIKAAKEGGLRNIHIGNIWILGDYY
ncbi:MAG: radical SAM protein [Sulfolobales archaeon]